MLLLGLTGSIATGKSTISALLASHPHSLPLIDADVLARKVVEPGTSGYRKIVEYFGPSTADLLLPGPVGDEGDDKPDRGRGLKGEERKGKGRPLNRPALGRRIFGDTDSKKRDRAVLNSIIHPAVRWEMYKALLYYYIRGYWAVVLDIPLLFESRLDLICGTVIVVAVRDPELQMRRLLDRDQGQGGTLTREEARGRVVSQGDIREKAERCERRNEGIFSGNRDGSRGLVIWNDGDKEELKRKVVDAMEKVRQRSPWWWSWICLFVPPVGLAAGVWQVMRNVMDRWAWERRQKPAKAKL